jgi:UDP-N-acetylmuramate--alanine ligase
LKIEELNMIYFLGIGGIGMSALANWCQQQGIAIAGYDRTPSPITRSLEQQGVPISYEDSKDTIPSELLENLDGKLVVYTPAVPADSEISQQLKSHHLPFLKRSQMLGIISQPFFTVAVAGTHGKTTTCSMIGHLLKHSGRPMTAFIGGITQNYGSNFLFDEGGSTDQIMVVEADEFDRSFLTLQPDIAVVTAMDPDHLDIYGETAHMHQSFREFVGKIKPGGKLFISHVIYDLLKDYVPAEVSTYTYGIEAGIFKANKISIKDNKFIFNIQSPEISMDEINLNMPGFHNVENAMSAIAVGWSLGMNEEEIREAVASYSGVKRRFEFIINKPDLVYIDDYAHHPVEIKALLFSVKKLYPKRKITAIFQPHLFSRTKDFYQEFAHSLNQADDVILLDIYPAREKPIPDVSSNMIANELTVPYELSNEDHVFELLADRKSEVVLTIGAGDIDQLVGPIKNVLLNQKHNDDNQD